MIKQKSKMKQIITITLFFIFSPLFSQEIKWEHQKESSKEWFQKQQDSLIGFSSIKDKVRKNKKNQIASKVFPKKNSWSKKIITSTVYIAGEPKPKYTVYKPSIVIRNLKNNENHFYHIEAPTYKKDELIEFFKLVDLKNHFFVIYKVTKENSLSFFSYEVNVKGKKINDKIISLGKIPIVDEDKITFFYKTSKNKKFYVFGHTYPKQKYVIHYSLLDYEAFNISSEITLAEKKEKKCFNLHQIDNNGNLYFSVNDSNNINKQNLIAYDIEGKKIFNIPLKPKFKNSTDTLSPFQISYHNHKKIYLNGFIYDKKTKDSDNQLLTGTYLISINVSTGKIVKSDFHYFTKEEVITFVGEQDAKKRNYENFYSSDNFNPGVIESEKTIVNFISSSISENEIIIAGQKNYQIGLLSYKEDIILMRFDLNSFEITIDKTPRKINLNTHFFYQYEDFYLTVINDVFYVLYNDDYLNSELKIVTKETIRPHGAGDPNAIGIVTIKYKEKPTVSFIPTPKKLRKYFITIDDVITINQKTLILPLHKSHSQAVWFWKYRYSLLTF